MDGIVFKIDGVSYPFVSSDEMTMDEAIILHDYSGLTLDQLEDLEGFNPKVVGAFVHIAIARKRPDLKTPEIRKMIGAIKVTDLADAFEEAEEKADARPPELSKSEGEKPPSSGASGANGGDPSPAPVPPEPTGSSG
jgi:hypothetical protein